MSVYNVNVKARDFVKTIYIFTRSRNDVTKVLYNDNGHNDNGEPRGRRRMKGKREEERTRSSVL